MAQLKKTYLTECRYQWDLVGIENKAMTILSKMIKFQGVKSFRVGLRNQATTSTLFLMTTNLNKMGLKVEAVAYSSLTTENRKMSPHTIITEDEDESRCLQLFTAPLDGIITENRSFSFQIYLTSMVQDYQIQEVDLLLRKQLWSSFKNQAGTDFEIVVEQRKFPVHKFMLAARSPVFAAKFQEDSREGESMMELSSVDADSVQQFIKFIYTGELEGPVKNQHLMQLAIAYKIKTLEDLCQAASHDIDGDQLASLGLLLNPAETEECAVSIQPDIDSEIGNLCTTLIFNCVWIPQDEIQGASSSSIITSKAFVFQKEKLFRAQSRYKVTSVPNPAYSTHLRYGHSTRPPTHITQTKVKLVFLSYYHEKLSYKVDEVTYSTGTDGDPWTRHPKLRESPTSNNKKLQVFAVDLTSTSIPSPITFHVKLSSTVANFGLTFADSTWTEQLWVAAVDKLLTDVEFLIAGESMYAHRFLLSARSSVFAAMFASGMEETRTGLVRIDDVDPDSFRHFLQFLYTGTLVPNGDKAKIFAAADKYQVETLMDLCRPSTQSVDIEATTEAFLSC